MNDVARRTISGDEPETEKALAYLRETLLPTAVDRMNSSTLPLQCSRFETDAVPTNQRNLTDVRNRVSLILEYELGKAIHDSIPAPLSEEWPLNFVIANRFPDLAFRARDGAIGVRFEIKAVQSIAEETAANFDTLIKDIRQSTDIVAVLLWEWEKPTDGVHYFPRVLDHFVLSAFELARMRDCKWLNSPPTSVGGGYQGLDLTFAVNCSAGVYNREEGNYGKLMRVWDGSVSDDFLPPEIRAGTTISEYRRLRTRVMEEGLTRVLADIAGSWSDDSETVSVSRTLPVVLVAQRATSTCVFVGDERMPKKKLGQDAAETHDANLVLTMSKSFSWNLRALDWSRVASGTKPAEAKQAMAARG